MLRRQGGVTASLTISTCDTNSRALSTNHSEAVLMSCRVGFHPLDTSAKLESLATVVLVLPVLDLNLLKVVCPNRKSACAGGLSIVAIAH
jgi:hypothetical protein